MIKKKKFEILLTIVFVLSTILICTLFCTGLVFADYEDVQNNANAIVNFNQLVSNDKINFTATGGSVTLCNNTNLLLAQNVLYVSVDISNLGTNTTLAITGPSVSVGTHSITNGYNSFIWVLPNRNGYNNLYIYESATTQFNNFKIINLTYMFGSGNEPNLQQCEELFVSDYYAYNSGSPMSLSGLNSYSQGFNDAVGGFEWTQTNSNFLISMQGVNKGIYQGTVSVYNNTYLRVENSNTASYYLTCYMPFNFVVPVGSNISFKGIFTHDYGHASEKLVFCYFDTNNQPITLATANFSGGANYGVNVSFTAPVDLSGVYMYLDELDGPTYFGCYNAAFSMLTLDPYAAIQSAYDSGFEKATEYYSLDGAGGQIIYNQGKQAGIEQANDYTFSSLMFSVINAPLQAVLNIFNFEFMGYNLKNFITIILTLCLILCIVNLFMGGK